MSKGMLPVIGLAVVVTASLPLATNAGWGKRKPCPPEYPSYFPVTPSPQASPEPGQPQTGPEASEPSEPSAVSFDDAFGAAGSSLETAGGPMSSTPFMLGDSFGLSGNFFLGYISSVDGGTQVSANSSTPIAGGRRFKIAESTSPLPRDRVFLTYNLFRDAYQTQSLAGGVPPIGRGRAGIGGPSTGGFPPGGPGVGSRSFDVHRFTFGLEKTFFNGMTSAEVRLPFSRTLGGNLVISPNTIPGDEDVLLDNMSLAFKSLLYTRRELAVSGGMIVNLPTGPDSNITNQLPDVLNQQTGNTVNINRRIRVRNDAVHLSPFLGYVLTPTDRMFFQGFTQFDIPLNGNKLTFSSAVNDVVESDQVRSINDQALLQLDFAAGYWLYRNPRADWLTGVASMIELHYTTTLQDADIQQFSVTTGNTSYTGIFGNTANRLDIWNLTLGTAFQIQERSTISTGFVLPLDKRQQNQNFLFDWEFQLQLNYQFGPVTRATQTPLF